jgi:glycine C-acetyltransferase
MDLFDKIVSDKGPLGKYADMAHGYFTFPKLEGVLGNRMTFKGKEKIIWSINNYLGLANHPEVRQVDAEAAKQWGLAYPMGSRMMSGESKLHEQLEQELSEFVNKEETMLFNFGYQGVFSMIDTLLSRHDVVIYDSESHACIIDGVRLHVGKRMMFKHNDLQSLEQQLAKAQRLLDASKQGGILVITEGVFGMRGDQGRLREIVALKEKFNFRLLVDDAHGFGTQGATGAGTGEEQGVQDQIDLYFSTFAKSMASIGAFVSGERHVIEFLRYNMRSQIFAKSLPMPLVVGALKRLELLRDKPELKAKLWENVNKLQHGLRAAGFDLGETASCVTPVYMHGSVEEALRLVVDLRENYHVFCSVVVYPVIPKDMILLRLIPTASHTDEDISYTIDAFSEVAGRLQAGVYREATAILQNN